MTPNRIKKRDRVRKNYMLRAFCYAFALMLVAGATNLHAQLKQQSVKPDTIKTETLPVVSYMYPKTHIIAGIDVSGVTSYDLDVVRRISGLQVGQRVQVPGDKFTKAVENYMKNGFFSDCKILQTKERGDSVWIEIKLIERPRLSKLVINGVKKSERDDLMKTSLASLYEGAQLSPNMVDVAKELVRKKFDQKGFSNVEVTSKEVPDPEKENYVTLVIDVNKNTKTKVNKIHFKGNENLTDAQLRKAMKKTNETFSLSKNGWSSFLEMFSQKKFVKSDYEEDLNNLLSLYHQHGYRDAELVRDSVAPYDEKKVDIFIKVDEGPKYYIKDINFVGNTKYNSADLERLLGMKPGDVYDQKKLEDRIRMDEDAISNIYANNGYLFSYIYPVETHIENDSVTLDIRVIEGKPATIDKIGISGNTRLYEDVVRRELYTKPGMLFNREYVMNSLRLINNMGHFDQENLVPDIVPNEENGTVDINYNLVQKSNDQIELSAGYGQTGLIGRVSLKFTNFSMKNLFNPKSYKGIIPQGEGQTLSLSAQTNGRYYQSYSIQFMDPWFGGKRPNMFSLSFWYSRYTGINERFYQSQMGNLMSMYGGGYGYGYGYGGYPYGGYGYGGYPYGGYGYGGYGYGGYGGYGYGYGGLDYSSIYESAYDPDKVLQMFGGSIMYGKRLTWPDNYFQIQAGLNYTLYKLKNWSTMMFSFGMDNGVANDINLSATISRSSIDNPVYTRRGSSHTLSISATPPYSLFDKVDYSDPKLSQQDRNRFIEYYKIKYKTQSFLPLLNEITHKRTPVLMARAEAGFIGSYNKYKRSPFGTFYMGGDGMTGYSTYLNETIGLRGYSNGSISGQTGIGAYSYTRMSLELRYPLLFEGQTNIWVLGFLEAGNAWQYNRDFNPFRLKRSAGIGVRITIPMIGLMGLDWGYGFDAPDGSSKKGGSNLHFVIGQEF